MSQASQPPAPPLGARLAAARRPDATVLGMQRWRRLLFLHWALPPDALRPVLPPGLDVDTFEGRAYVGLVPFLIRGNRLRFLPPVPGTADFLELNLRTYVHWKGHDPGVWFFSLDASNLLAVLAARLSFRLPYFQAAMGARAEGGVTHYHCDRVRPEPTPARVDVRYRVGEPLDAAVPGSLDHFLVERYLLYADWGRAGLKVGQVHHQPYPLQRAEVQRLDCASLFRAHGLPAPDEPPHALYSPGVDVEVFALRRPRGSA
jgi:uncharacterized protein YqjF (DUF2071 family)